MTWKEFSLPHPFVPQDQMKGYKVLFNDLVNIPYGICLGIGTLIGGWNASRFSVDKGEGVVKIFLVISAIIIAIKLWFF